MSTNALASSIILVCRPRAANTPIATRREFVTALKAELPIALTHLQRGNIAPVDLAQSAIGPGMAVYTRYARVLDAAGKQLSVREALALINQTLDEVLAEQEGDFDGLRADLRQTGDFSRVHPLPQSGQDVPDDMDARLVVLGPEHPYSREAGNRVETTAKAIFESRGNTPRLFRNTLTFLAVDQTRLQDLDESVRRYLAWESILTEKETLDLSPYQVRQAETQKASADSAVTARLPEAYQWLLVPVQDNPQKAVEWHAFRLSGQDALAVRASKKLKNDELLVPALAGTRLKMELDRVPLWRGDHVPVRQLAEDFARYLYLPRLVESAVLRRAIEDGLGLLTWASDSFAYADSYDEATGRYRGLRGGATRCHCRCRVTSAPQRGP
jgi:hypothetical protein